MSLVPYPDPERRWEKVCRHVFAPAERWWEIFGTLTSWHADWSTLRGQGCFNGPGAWVRAGADASVRDVAERNHAEWFTAANRACEEARESGPVYPTEDTNRVCFIGENGVTVYVARERFLATCFRPRGCVGLNQPASETTERATKRAAARVPTGWHGRAAVRRQHRRASLQAQGRRHRSPQEDQ